jgi:hypothetical protein
MITREKIAEIFAKVGIDTTGLSKDFAMLRGILRKGLAAAMIGIGAGLSIASITTKLAADAEEAANLFQIVFKHATDSVIADLNRFAQEAGRGRHEMKNYAAGFGALLNPMGFTTEEVAKLSTQLAILGSDMASFFNTTDEDAAFALTSALTGQIRPMRRYGVNIAKAAVEQEALAMGLIKNKKEMTQQIKVQALMNVIMRETEQLQGDAIRTQASLTNQWRRFWGALHDIGVEIGTTFRPMATQLFTLLGSFLQPLSQNQALFERWAKVLDDELKKVIASVLEAATATYNAFTGGGASTMSVTGAIQAVSEGIQWLAGQVTALMSGPWGGMIAGVIKSIPSIAAMTVAVGALETAIASVAAIFTSATLVSLVNPITLISAAVVGLAAAMLDAKAKGQTWSDSIAEWTARLFNFQNAVTASNAAMQAASKSSEGLKQVRDISGSTKQKLDEGTMNSKQLQAELDKLRQIRAEEKARRQSYQRAQADSMRKANENAKIANKSVFDPSHSVIEENRATLAVIGYNKHVEAMNDAIAGSTQAMQAIDRKIKEFEGELASLSMFEQSQVDVQAAADAKQAAIDEGKKQLLGWGKTIAEKTKEIGGQVVENALYEVEKSGDASVKKLQKEAVDNAVAILGLTPDQISEMQKQSKDLQQQALAKQVAAEGLGIDPSLLDNQKPKPTAQFMGLADYARNMQSAIGGTPEMKIAKKTEDNTAKTAAGVEKVVTVFKELSTDVMSLFQRPAAAS